MKRSIIILFICSITQLAVAQSMITVKQDGTGDYTTIQQAVDAANYWDTVLIWPGTYIENVSIENKNIIMGSLTLITGDPSYIAQTRINGNHSGSCIKIYNSSDPIKLNGLLLEMGSGSDHGFMSGGGISIEDAEANIYNCKITNNTVTGDGGGLYCVNSEVFFSNSWITNNHAYISGGGIYNIYGEIEFDSLNLCNIYLNYATWGTDIFKVGAEDSLHLYADTFTVIEPDYYYLYSFHGFGIQGNDIFYNITTGKTDAVAQDLYVSPTGDNQNSGLTPGAPLKNIYYALLKMSSDSINPHTIHVANGFYAPSTGEKYPLSIKGHFNLMGESRDSTILDGEDEIYLLQSILDADNYQISKLTIQHGNGNKNSPWGFGGFYLRWNKNSRLENILVRENTGEQEGGGCIYNSNGFQLTNVEFVNNIGGGASFGHADYNIYYDTMNLINCSFTNNIPDYSIPPEEGGFGGGFVAVGDAVYQDLFTLKLYNCLFIENHTKQHPYGGMSQISMVISRNSKAYAMNCTFGDNTSDNLLGANIGVTSNSGLSIYNSILYHNDPAELYMYTFEGNSYLSIYNSLVQDGEEGIRLYTSGNVVYYDPSNIDTDPMFDTTSMYPYSLSAGSPCIDAGTIDLPPGIELPETDLAGNTRVYNGYVDMGAYEYGPWVTLPDYNSKLKTQNLKLLKVWPNPFRFETTVSYISDEKGHTRIRIYDLQGKHVKTMLDVQGLPGSGTMKWNGKDQNGNVLKAGTYIISIIINGKEKDALKVVKR